MVARTTFPGQWRRRKGTINSFATEKVLEVGLGDFRSLKIIASCFSEPEDKTKQLTIDIVQQDGDVSSAIGPVAGRMNLTIDPVKNGTVLEVNVTNNEGYHIKYNWLVAFFKADF